MIRLSSLAHLLDRMRSGGLGGGATAARPAPQAAIADRGERLGEAIEELRTIRRRLYETQRLAQIGDWEIHFDTGRFSCSDEILRIYEIDPAATEPGYAALRDVVHAEDRERVERARQESAETGTPYGISYRLSLRDGRVKFVRERGETLRREDGRPLRSIGTVQDVTEKVESQRERERTQTLIATVMDSSPDWVFVKDREHRYMMVNRSLATALGREPAEMIGQLDTTLWSLERCEGEPERGIRGLRDDDREALAGRVVHNPDVEMTLPDGALRIFDTYKCPLRDASGEIFGVLGYARDATARRRMETALRESSELLERRVRERTAELAAERNFTETLLQTVGALVVVLDRDGRIVRFNRTCELVTGYPAYEALGHRLRDFLLPPEERDAVEHVFAELCDGRYPNTYENVWLTRDGRRRVIAWSNSVITDRSGVVEYVVGTGVDVSERKAAEAALRASEAMFREMADNINEVFWLVSPDRRTMHYVSPAFEQVWGHTCAALYANPKIVFDMIHPEDRDRIMIELAPQMRGEFRDRYDQEYRIIRPDGEIRWLHTRYRTIRDANGVVYRIAGVGEDVTERKLAEVRRLQQMREQRDTLVREVHHRIKNNLQGVVGLLRQHVGEFPDTKAPLETAIARIQSMALVYGLRSDADAEQLHLSRMVAAIARAVTELTGVAIEAVVERRAVRLIRVTPDEAVPVALILNELTFNAVKHQPAAGRRPPVTIHVDFEDGCAVISVAAAGSRLPAGFDFAAGRGLGSGLQLVRSLLPKPAASLELRDSGDGVVAVLFLAPPVIVAPCADETDDQRADFGTTAA